MPQPLFGTNVVSIYAVGNKQFSVKSLNDAGQQRTYMHYITPDVSTYFFLTSMPGH